MNIIIILLSRVNAPRILQHNNFFMVYFINVQLSCVTSLSC